jgi:hypothetical protein
MVLSRNFYKLYATSVITILCVSVSFMVLLLSYSFCNLTVFDSSDVIAIKRLQSVKDAFHVDPC